MKDWKILLILIAVFLAAFWLPVENVRFQNGLIEGFALLKEYARDHVLLCLVPAFFIAGAISVFISKAAVIKYLGAQAKKVLSYGVASVSGTILAVCSCTVLPLFSGIYTRGAGIGPATAFLYSGPAINILAIILTAKVLGYKLGLARAVGAVVFAVVIGLIMHLVFGKEEKNRKGDDLEEGDEKKEERPLGKTALYFAVMIGILVFINWGKSDPEMKVWYFIYQIKWFIGLTFLAILAWMILTWFKKPELKEWTFSTWVFAKQILPLLFAGVLVAGLLLGRPGHEGVIPSQWVAQAVASNQPGRQSLRIGGWSSDVLCHSDRSPHPSRPVGLWNGTRASLSLAAVRTGIIAPQHAGDSKRHRHEKNFSLYLACGHHGNHNGNDFWVLFLRPSCL